MHCNSTSNQCGPWISRVVHQDCNNLSGCLSAVGWALPGQAQSYGPIGGAGQYGAAPGYQQPRPIGGGYAGPQMGYQGVQSGPIPSSTALCTCLYLKREPFSMSWHLSSPASSGFYLQVCCETKFSSRTSQARHGGLHRVRQCMTHLALTLAGQPQYPSAVPPQQHVMSTNPFAVLQPRARRDPRHR